MGMDSTFLLSTQENDVHLTKNGQLNWVAFCQHCVAIVQLGSVGPHRRRGNVQIKLA